MTVFAQTNINQTGYIFIHCVNMFSGECNYQTPRVQIFLLCRHSIILKRETVSIDVCYKYQRKNEWPVLLSWVCLLDFNDVGVRQWRCSSGSSHRFIYRMLCCMFIPTCHRQPECLHFDADFFFNATIIAVYHGDRTSMCVSLCWDERFCCFLPSYTLTYPRLDSTQLEMFASHHAE